MKREVFKRVICVVCATTLLFSLGACASGNFKQLGFGTTSDLAKDLNKFLEKQQYTKLPEFKPEDNADKDIYSTFDVAKLDSITLAACKEKSGSEKLVLNLPYDMKNNPKAIGDYLGIICALVDKFAGFDYIQPVGKAIIEEARESFNVGSIVFTFTIDEDEGYIFTVSTVL
ncbi:MAG: hypothetical protein FWG10_10395 [Eubacteriaceae bacterium]|nr:hypothetical protein [Eubacteriaceae bacterium]